MFDPWMEGSWSEALSHQRIESSLYPTSSKDNCLTRKNKMQWKRALSAGSTSYMVQHSRPFKFAALSPFLNACLYNWPFSFGLCLSTFGTVHQNKCKKSKKKKKIFILYLYACNISTFPWPFHWFSHSVQRIWKMLV